MSKKRVVVIAVLLMVVVLGGVGAVGLWQYHEQPEFCATCHIMDSYLESWQSSDYGAAAHAEQDVACLDCHEPTVQQQMDELVMYVQGDFAVPLEEREFPAEFCFDCHDPNEHTGYEEVIQRTEGSETNPHDSHLGEMECSTCHKMHGPSEDYCAQCHDPVATGAGWTTEVSTAAEIDVWDPDRDCAACHAMDPYLESLEDTNLLASAHVQEGLECLDCHIDLEELQRAHEEAVPGRPVQALSVEKEFCFDCHVPNEHTTLEQVIQRTAALEPNPHESALGDLDCQTCHKMHEPSTIAWSPETDCALCHLDPQMESLEDANLLASAHAQEGLVCEDCHSDAEALAEAHAGAVPGGPVSDLAVKEEFCFDCHVANEHASYEQIIELTADYIIDDQNINPHDAHPGSEEVEPLSCSACHKVHKVSPLVNGCYGCHHQETLESCSTCH